MVIIITGATHCGKTLAAQRLLERLKYPYLSIDHLKMGLIRSKNTALSVEDDKGLTEYLWPIVAEMIKTVIENGQNIIVEGGYVPFDWRNSFSEEYLPQIKLVCLAMSESYIEANFENIKAHSSDIEKRLDGSELTCERLKTDNRFYIAGFSRAGENVCIINENYEKTLDEILNNF